MITEDRQKLWDEYTGAKPHYISWPWLQYTRYRKAETILNTLKELGEQISNLRVLDYGSGVGDYGFVFGRQGAKVTFFDRKEELDFSKYRVSKEPITSQFFQYPEDYDELHKDGEFDLVIFGEVLEHVENPIEILQSFSDKKTKYIYTSSYPYRSDDPNEYYWKKHGDDQTYMIEMQKPCRAILEANYTFVKYEGEARLWIRK